jgi:hypothetical protein
MAQSVERQQPATPADFYVALAGEVERLSGEVAEVTTRRPDCLSPRGFVAPDRTYLTVGGDAVLCVEADDRRNGRWWVSINWPTSCAAARTSGWPCGRPPGR